MLSYRHLLVWIYWKCLVSVVPDSFVASGIKYKEILNDFDMCPHENGAVWDEDRGWLEPPLMAAGGEWVAIEGTSRVHGLTSGGWRGCSQLKKTWPQAQDLLGQRESKKTGWNVPLRAKRGLPAGECITGIKVPGEGLCWRRGVQGNDNMTSREVSSSKSVLEEGIQQPH